MTISNTYAIPVDGDKVFRSNKHGQAELKKMPGVQRIFVEKRDNSLINQNGLRLVGSRWEVMRKTVLVMETLVLRRFGVKWILFSGEAPFEQVEL